MILSGLKKVKKNIDKRIEDNFFLLLLFMVLIGVTRNTIEMIGYFSRSPNYRGYFPTLSSFLDTISYVFLILIGELYLINIFFGGSKKQLRTLIRRCAWMLLGLFILIPVLNNIFNYHFFYLPISYNLDFIHPVLSIIRHYGPVGINIAFAIVMFGLPFWIKRFYGCSMLRSFLIVWLFCLIHYLVTYPIMIEASWGRLAKYNPLLIVLTPLNAYTFWFLVLVLLVYPFFMEDYPKNKTEGRMIKIGYYILWLMFISLFFIGGPY